MWAVVSALGVVAILIAVYEVRAGKDSLWRWFRESKGQGDQDKRDEGKLPYDYFEKER